MKKFYVLLFALLMTQLSFGQISGTFTIPGAPYATIAAAISAINTSGIGAGGVTFNVTAGYTETFASPTAGTITTNTGTLANQIKFQKSGSGANPKITAATGTGTMDAIICFNGVKYVTFNGIDLYESAGNTTTTTQMEWGYAVLKNSGTQGSQNITIQNCTISLNNTNVSTWGIYLNNHTSASTTSLTVTSAAGTSSNNKFYGNTITNCYNGIELYGYSDVSPYTFYDQNNDIGSVTGNTINNFGGGASAEYLIYVYYQNGITIANSTISGTGGGTSSIYGIYGGTSTNANASIYGNTVSITQSAATTGYIYGIYNTGLGTGGTTNTLNVYNNTVQNCSEPNSTTSYLYGIYVSATAMTINFYGNTVTNNVFGGSYYMYLCYVTSAAGGTSNVYNNTVTNNQRSGAGTQSGSAYLYCLYVTGSGSTSIHDNQVFGNSCPGQTSYAAYIYGIYCSNSATSQMVYNNTVRDQTVTSSYAGAAALYGIYSYPGSGGVSTNALYNNNVYNLTISNSSASGYGYIYGIYGYYMGNIYSNNLYNITVNNSSTGYGYGYGYYVGGSGTFNVYKNRLYNISMAGSSGYFYGYYITGPSLANIYNNFVSDLKAPASTSSTYGMYISSATTCNFYYNTIYLNATSSSVGAFNIYGIYAPTATNTEMRNNIIINTSTAPGSTTYRAACYYRSSNSLGTYAATSNNNDFYAGTPSATNLIFYDGTNSVQTLAAYKTLVSPRDGASITELPPFVNIAAPPYNLHLQTTVATQCESGGSVVSTPNIIDDYDAQARYPNPGYPVGSSTPTAPDIGADEFGGIILDQTPPNISFTPLQNTSSLTARTLTTTITDATGVPITGAGLPRLYWKKFAAGTWNTSIATYVSGSTYTFSLGVGVVLNDSIYYHIVAQDLVTPTPNVGGNPPNGSGYTINPPACSTPPPNASLYAYKIVGSLCGTYNVGVGQIYTTLTAAIADLNLKEVTCPVIFQLMDASYGASETFPITIGNAAGTSPTNTVTIKPASGVTATITGASSSTIIKLNQASNIILDGSNSGGSDRSLTISNTMSSGTTAAIWVGSNGMTAGSGNVTIKNCNLACGYNQSTSSCGIFAGSSGTILSSGDDNDNLKIQNNSITNSTYGIYIVSSIVGLDDNLLIKNNTIGSATLAQSCGYYGIYINGANAPMIQGNEIFNFSTLNSWNISGINLYANVPNGVVMGNKIHDLQSIASGGWGCYGISIGYGSSTVQNTLIANNVIYNLNTINYSASSSMYNPFGIWLYSGTGHKIYHNTVNMNGTQNNTGSAASLVACLLYYSSGVSGTDVRNNIFASGQGSTIAGTQSFCIYAPSGTTFSTINYNDYWPYGSYGVLGYLGANQTTLAAWRTATGQDVNSINTDPSFVSTTDLHPTAGAVQRACNYLPDVTTDFSGTLRTNPTDMGAYQVSVGSQSVTTNAASVITSSGATLNGSITANSLTVASVFEYGLTTAYGTTVAGVPATVTGASATAISYALTGLQSCTLYHFRAKGTSGAVIVNGSDFTFTTLGTTPTTTTNAATLVTGTTATLNGTVNPNGASTNITFDYGLTTSYGSTVAGIPSPITGSTAQAVSAAITGLLPGNTYHFRVNGANSCVTGNGPDLTFTTPAIAPVAITTAATAVTSSSATLNGTVNPGGASTTVTFDWGLTTTYGNSAAAAPSPITGNTTTNVSANILGLVTNSTYHFRVKAVNSVGTIYGNDLTFLTNCPVAGPAGPITGPTQVCQGGSGYVYTVTIPNATGYVWTLPVGGSITGGSGTNTITVSYNATASPGYVFVYGTAACGNGAPSQLGVAMNPPATPTVTGPASVCVNSTTNYTTQAGMTGYTWTVSAGGTITGGATTNAITVNWTTTGAKTITVNYQTAAGCWALAPTSYAVTVNALPVPTISGPSPACSNYPGLVYSTQAGMTGYTWSISAGGTITSGGTTNTVLVTWNVTGAQSISVNYTNANGCTAAAAVTYPVTVNSGAAPTITGPNSPCVNSGYNNYSTQPGMSGYAWTISSGGVINYGAGTNTITVSWTSSGAQWVAVNYTNPGGCSAVSPTQYPVTVNPLPGPAGSITGTATVCGGANGVAYSTPVITGASTYVWTLPTGATIASGAGTNAITVNFAGNASSGNITVVGNNMCGNGTASAPFAVIVNALPANAGTITGPASVCQGDAGKIYNVPAILGATGYVWSLPAGAAIVAGNNTNAITVDFDATAVSGVITVAGTNSCGSGTVSPNFNLTVNPIPAAAVVSNTGYTANSSAAAGNQWYYSVTATGTGAPISGATGQNYDATLTGTGYYWVIVTVNGCPSAESNRVLIITTGVENHAGAGISLYPVPNDGRFNVTFSSNDTYTISIFNSIGVKIYEEKNVDVIASTTKVIDLRPVPSGVYTVIFENSLNQVVKKIVVNK